MICFACNVRLSIFKDAGRIYMCSNQHYICGDCNKTSTCAVCKQPIRQFEHVPLHEENEISATTMEIRIKIEASALDVESAHLNAATKTDKRKMQSCGVQVPDDLIEILAELDIHNGNLKKNNSKECQVLMRLGGGDCIEAKENVLGFSGMKQKSEYDIENKLKERLEALDRQKEVTAETELPGKETIAPLSHLIPNESAKATISNVCSIKTPAYESSDKKYEEQDEKAILLRDFNINPADLNGKPLLTFAYFPLRCPACQMLLFPTWLSAHMQQQHDIEEFLKEQVPQKFNVKVSEIFEQDTVCLKTYLLLYEQAVAARWVKQNIVPVYVNCCKVLATDLVDMSSFELPHGNKIVQIIFWVTMLIPKNRDFSFTLGICNNKLSKPVLHAWTTSKVLDVSKSYDLQTIYRTPGTMCLYSSLVKNMATADGNLTLQLEIN